MKIYIIIHNDIKPNNICWGKFNKSYYIEKSSFFLIDFCYSRKIGALLKNKIKIQKINENNILFHEERKENIYAGIAEFIEIKPSKGVAIDIEELIYTLLFLLKKNFFGMI